MSAAAESLAKRINAECAAAEADVRSAVEHATRAGELLLEAKKAVGHGAWLEWLEANVAVSPRMAQNYMRLARALPKLDPENTKRVSHLSVREALKAGALMPSRLVSIKDPTAQSHAIAAIEAGAHSVSAVRGLKEQEVRAKFHASAPAKDGPIVDGRPIAVDHYGPGVWTVTLGANTSPAKYEALRNAVASDVFRGSFEKAAALEKQAVALEKQAKDLRREAAEIRRTAERSIAKQIQQEHGDLYIGFAYLFFRVAPERDAELEALPPEKQYAALRNCGLPEETRIRGDLRHAATLNDALSHPARGWTRVGFEA